MTEFCRYADRYVVKFGIFADCSATRNRWNVFMSRVEEVEPGRRKIVSLKSEKAHSAPPPSALQEFLKKLDGLLGLQEASPDVEAVEPNEDMTDIVRHFNTREEM